MKIEDAHVERTGVTGPVKIGIGSEDQFAALYEAGADEVRSFKAVQKMLLDYPEILQIAFREEDTVIVVQPNLLTVDLIKRISGLVQAFHIPGHGDFKLRTDRNIRLFRKLKPEIEGVKRVENRGAVQKYPTPTERQRLLMMDWWHSGEKLAEVVDRVSEMLMADVPSHWVRDQVKKWTGSAARDPEAEGKRPREDWGKSNG